MMKKAMMSISTTILVVSTLVLITSALFLFILKAENIQNKLDVSSINRIYVQKEILDFEIREIANQIVLGDSPDKQFKEILTKYIAAAKENPNPNLINLQKQVNSSSVYFSNGNNLTISLNIGIVDKTFSPKLGDAYSYTIKYYYPFNYIRGV